VVITLDAPGQALATWDVFTTAFRKIDGGSARFNGGGTIQWNSQDKTGIKAASGLYYLRLEVQTSGGTIRKVFKILVVR
jgi:hypothetical protein